EGKDMACSIQSNRPMPEAKVRKKFKPFRFASQRIGSVGYRTTKRGGGGHGAMSPLMRERPSREGYAFTPDNNFHHAQQKPLSTFSIDVDTASYSNVRRFLLQSNRLPPADAVRIEELLNYFPYDTTEPVGKEPFAVSVELTEAPWNPQHKIARIAVQGKKVAPNSLPPANLVFLVDVSGSMYSPNKLPLLKRSLAALVRQLRPQDKVSIVVYAGAAGVVLPPTSGDQKEHIVTALNRLRAGGSTAGGAGIRLAYELARKSARPGTNNRVILCTDGDFNVGQSSDGELVRMIEKQRQSNVFLTVLGFGRGNYQDAKMQLLADKGNGNHAYIDSDLEARKVLVENMGGTLLTIAKDVKIQVEFNPKRVAQYRLIGYANRKLAARDFKDDKKDAGELGSGHHVTALYELVPTQTGPVSELRYQKTKVTAAADAGELMFVKLRWKQPKDKRSTLRSFPIADLPSQLKESSSDQRFALAVTLFGMKLRGSKEAKSVSWQQMMTMAQQALGEDRGGYRKAFIKLIGHAARLGS
ncbi:MAG TPA: VWA domain-containing protein, partial [Myxococcales bacterium]|nr:VWA domain-containing protein [Myxococcales bacterium]